MKEEFGSASGKGIERTLNTVLPLKALRTAVLASHGSGHTWIAGRGYHQETDCPQ